MAFSADYDFEKTGYNIWVTFSADPTLILACKSVKDAGFEAGDPIDITTNATVGAMEQAPADLPSPTDITLTAAYNLADREKAFAILGQQQDISIEYRACKNRARGRKITYTNASLSGFDPQEMSMGSQPEVSVTIALPGGTHYGEADYNPAGTLTEIASD